MSAVVEEELEVLRAIYGEEFEYSNGTFTFRLYHNGAGSDSSDLDADFKQFDATAMLLLTVLIEVDKKYPATRPTVTFTRTRGFNEDHLNQLKAGVYGVCDENKGECMIHMIVDHLKTQMSEMEHPSDDCVICMHPLDQDFIRTSCFHYYHTPCLAAYVQSCRQVPFEESNAREFQQLRSQCKTEEEYKHLLARMAASRPIKCPVCREVVTSDPSFLANTNINWTSHQQGQVNYKANQKVKAERERYRLLLAEQEKRGATFDAEKQKGQVLAISAVPSVSNPGGSSLPAVTESTTPPASTTPPPPRTTTTPPPRTTTPPPQSQQPPAPAKQPCSSSSEYRPTKTTKTPPGFGAPATTTTTTSNDSSVAPSETQSKVTNSTHTEVQKGKKQGSRR